MMEERRLSAADGRGREVVQTRWEYGSQFHWQPLGADGERGQVPWTSESVRLGCGRDALRALLEHLQPSRLWLPSYLCQELVAPFVGSDLDLRCYPDSPLEPSLDLQRIPLRARDAVLVVNYFGLGSRGRVLPTSVQDVTIVEDHTHAPCSDWAQGSQADYCFASLRKSIPIPDGAVLWSPQSRELPRCDRARFQRSEPVQQRLAGMLLKSLYLGGHDVSKPIFRELLDRGEQQIAEGSISTISPLSGVLMGIFPFATWQSARRRNFRRLTEGLAHASGFDVLEPADPQVAPFAVVCVFPDADDCVAARKLLVARGIYPSRLWPLDKPALEGVPVEHVSLSRRMFALPCDGRYGESDVDRVLETFSQTDLL